MMSPQGDRSFPTSEYNMFLYEELACGVAVTKTLPVERLEKQPSLGSLNNQTDQDSESVEGVFFILLHTSCDLSTKVSICILLL